jgi:hypothetical protein
MSLIITLIFLGGVQSFSSGLSIRYLTIPLLALKALEPFKNFKVNVLSCVCFGYLLILWLSQMAKIVLSMSDQWAYLINISFSTIILIIFLEFRIWTYIKTSRYLLYSTIIIIAYAAISVYCFVFLPEFWLVLKAITQTDANLLNFTRLYLPMGTTAQLAYVCTLLLILNHFTVRSKVYLLCLSACLFGTAANSSIIPLLILIFTANFLRLGDQELWLKSIFTIIILLLIIAFGSFVINEIRGNGNVFDSAARHLMLRKNALDLIFSGHWNVLSGIGVGQSEILINGRYTFTVWLTVLLEQGINGLAFILFFYFYLFKISRGGLRVVPIFVLLASQLYQLNTDLTFYVLPILVIKLALAHERDSYAI